jgi:hypothetical protein
MKTIYPYEKMRIQDSKWLVYILLLNMESSDCPLFLQHNVQSTSNIVFILFDIAVKPTTYFLWSQGN